MTLEECILTEDELLDAFAGDETFEYLSGSIGVAHATTRKTALKIIERIEQLCGADWVAKILRKELGL